MSYFFTIVGIFTVSLDGGVDDSSFFTAQGMKKHPVFAIIPTTPPFYQPVFIENDYT
jgi:hypothetical protein